MPAKHQNPAVRSTLGSFAFVTVFVLYATGLVIWLSLGLLPTLAAETPAVHDWFTRTAATSDSWLSSFAERILDGAGSIGDVRTAIVQYLFSLLNATLGVVLVVRRPHDTVPRLLAFALLGTAATFNEPSHDVFHVVGGLPLETAVHFVFHVVSGVAYLWAVVLFPDGKLPASATAIHKRDKERVMAERIGILAMTLTVLFISWRSSFISHPPFFVLFFGILIPLFGVASQSLRIRYTGDAVEQQQARLFRGSLLPAFVLSSVWLVTWISTKLNGPFSGDASRTSEQIADIFPAVFVLIPVMLVISVLRYRLWDIDVLVSRTLLYASLATAVVVAFVLLVSVSSALLGENVWSTAVSASVVATAINPLRRRFEAIANRIVFGQEMTPSEARRSLAQGLQGLTPEQELQQLTETVVEATRAVSARIWLTMGDHLLLASIWPDQLASVARESTVLTRAKLLSEAKDARVMVEIRHLHRSLGILEVSLPTGERLTAANERLIDELASHAGLLVYNVQLTTELQRHVRRLDEQARHLRRSREQIVATHDAERHRLERDLHDGAQQELVALLVNLKALVAVAPGAVDTRAVDKQQADDAEREIEGGKPEVDKQQQLVSELDELRAMVQSTSIAVRTLCRGDLPEIVVTHGLHAALHAASEPLRRSGVEVMVNVDLTGTVPPDVEAAVYFCCLEALQNIAKHAQATHVTVDVETESDSLMFEVIDNGRGFEVNEVKAASGISNMAERISLAGGVLAIDATPGQGASVRGHISLNVSDLVNDRVVNVDGMSS